MSCDHCRHYMPVLPATGEGPSRGLCRRFPPVPVTSSMQEPPTMERPLPPVTFQWQSLWPSVVGDMLCGEFTMKEESKS